MGTDTAGSPTKAGATTAKRTAKRRTIDSTSMAPLPVVKPIEYEGFLQDYLNKHPTIGDKQLLKAMVQDMHVTCSRQAMRTWLDSHKPITVEPDIAHHEDFLFEQLAKKPDIGSTAMCTAIRKAK